jgi:spore coat protein H
MAEMDNHQPQSIEEAITEPKTEPKQAPAEAAQAKQDRIGIRSAISVRLLLAAIVLMLLFTIVFAFFRQGVAGTPAIPLLGSAPENVLPAPAVTELLPDSNQPDESVGAGAGSLSHHAEASTGSATAAVTPGAEPDESALPVMFSAAFDQEPLNTTVWAYDIRRALLVREDRDVRRSDANSLLQLGHEEEWSAIALERGHNWRNYVVEMDVQLLNIIEDADNFFLGVRYDRNKGEYAVSLDMAGQLARLSSTIDGLWEGILHEAPVALDSDTWYRIRANVEDDLITFFVDDHHIGTINNGLLRVGSIRMLTSPGSFVYVDNIIVREIPSWPEPGDLLITEFMFRDEGFQWFELLNNTDKHIKIDGIEITNGTESYKITHGPRRSIAPHSYMVLASHDTTPYFSLDSQSYIYGSSLRFPPDNGHFQLRVAGRTITEIEYSEDTGWLLQDNVSVALHPDYLFRRRQNNGFNWCLSVQRLSATSRMRATPGQPNHGCVRELPFHNYGYRQTGELVITEIMIDLPGPNQGREWFEVYNTTGSTLSLKGWTIATDSPTEKHTITEDVNVPPGSYAVLAQAGLITNDLPENLLVYYYPGALNLRNGDGELSLFDGERLIDSVTWRDNDWWPFRGGVAMSLHPDATAAYANDDALNWCLAWSRIEGPANLFGTPGAPNDPCPMWEINSPLQDAARAFEPSTLAPITLYITADPKDLESMDANPFSNREYPARFFADGFETGEGNNATIRPRGGRSTRSDPIKSFRIRLEEPFWGHRTLMLNKHLNDPSRLRNSLAFRLLAEMEDMVSMRTQFVHLFVNGQDFGLYTMIESQGVRFLRNHNLDERGHLFKIGLPSGTRSFFFYDNVDRTTRINSIQVTAEIEAGYSHDGLIQVMDAVYSDMDSDELIERHFNRENLLTYFATLYLMENPDTVVHNYMLYTTPREPGRIYFLPWDWDNAFLPRDNRAYFVGRWREGLGNWVGIGIYDRIMREPDLVDALVFKMVELAQTSLSPEQVSTLVDQLVAEVEPFTRRRPELYQMTPAALATETEIIRSILPDSAQRLALFLERPLPFAVNSIIYDRENSTVTFTWYESYDLQHDPLSYEVVLFSQRQWAENGIVWRSAQTADTSLTISANELPEDLNAGLYYWMVYVWDSNGNYNTSSNLDPFGIIAHTVDLP